MTIDKPAILSRLAASEPSEIVDMARAFLSDETTRPVSGEPAHGKASQALALWKTRLAIATTVTHRPIHGAEPLVARLEAFPPDTDLEQIGFIGSGKGGVLFFDGESGEFIGVAIGDGPSDASTPESP